MFTIKSIYYVTSILFGKNCYCKVIKNLCGTLNMHREWCESIWKTTVVA